jgi:hypothetical protein
MKRIKEKIFDELLVIQFQSGQKSDKGKKTKRRI